jgi:HAD superfamily hydrolase (TIGR01549 family)
MKNLFVWDFHGTLETGNIYAVQELVNLVLKDFKINKEVSIKEVRDWYGLSWFDYFKLAVPEGNDKLWQDMVNKVLSLQQRGWNIIKTHIKLRESAEEVLKTIKKEGHQNILLSNASPQHIKKFTDLLNITKYFTDIIGVDKRHVSRINKEINDNKSKALTDFLRKREYNKVVVIGDRESDIKAGRNCGATTYLFIDPAFNENAKNTEADYIISDLKEILKQLKS